MSGDELERVNFELRAAGIEYPLGARGVHDLASMLDGYRCQVEAVRVLHAPDPRYPEECVIDNDILPCATIRALDANA